MTKALIPLLSLLLAAPAAAAVNSAGPGVSWARQDDRTHVVRGHWASPAADPVAAARQWLQGPGRGLADDAALIHSDTRTSPIGTYVTFTQRAGGLPVLDGYVRVSFDEDGAIVGGWSTTLAASATPINLTPRQARAIAVDALGDADLMHWSPDIQLGATAMGSVYRVDLPARSPAGVWRVEVNATSGEIAGPIEDIATYATGTGRVFYISPSVALETNDLSDRGDRAFAIPPRAYTQVDLLEIDDSGYLVGPYVDTQSLNPDTWAPFSDTGVFNYNRADNSFEAVQCYWALDYAQRTIQGLGFDDVNNRQIEVAVNSYPADNSFYTAGTITMGSGGVDDGEDTEVIWHEMGHAIHADQVPGWGTSHEARAMGEGFGDFIAASLGSDFSDGFQDACVAEWDAISYSNTNPPCLRRVDGTKTYPDDLNGSVHSDGEIWSGALWEIRATLGNDEALSILLASHFLLSPSATMEEAAVAFSTAADSYGLSVSEINTIHQVFKDRGLL